MSSDNPLGDLADTIEDPSAAMRRIDRRMLGHPLAIQAIGGTLIAVAVLIWPDRTDRILVRLLGLAFLWFAASTSWAALRDRRVRPSLAATVAVAAAAGVVLVVLPEHSQMTIGRMLGLSIIIGAVRAVLLRRNDAERTGDERVPGTLRFLSSLTAGSMLIAFPATVLSTVTVALAVGWIGVSMVALAALLEADPGDPRTEPDGSVPDVALDWLADRHKSADARHDLYDKILFDGPEQRRRITRFFTLMTFASIIAAMGVITDSTAVVIGAMLIAPLMTPLMAMAISLVMGWPNRLGIAVAVAAAGILLAIGIGILLGLVVPAAISTDTNTQILARSTPTLLDLITALAAGAAGAYGLSRPDVSDSLPGVAIAISLVPPLSVVGIAYSQADWAAGNGALLLFMTNMVAILLMGGVTFVFTGVAPLDGAYSGPQRIRTALTSVGFLAVVVFGGLLLNGASVASDALDQKQTANAVDGWLSDDPAHRVVQTGVEGNTVTVTVVGPADGLPDVDLLATDLSDAFGRDIVADVRLVVEERITSGG